MCVCVCVCVCVHICMCRCVYLYVHVLLLLRDPSLSHVCRESEGVSLCSRERIGGSRNSSDETSSLMKPMDFFPMTSSRCTAR